MYSEAAMHKKQSLMGKEVQSNHQIDIVFQNVSYFIDIQDKNNTSKIPCFKKYSKKYLLHNISGIFKAGQMAAIMGASGAGKTTLLNVLACRVPTSNLQGKILANNTPYDFNNFGDFANYVMQNDVLMQTLTVRQTLQFAAHLKLNIANEQKTQKINYLAKKLKLQKCLDVLVGGPIVKGISGGQKKRTSIAFQLISDPKVLMLDQPTSGLDSLTSFIIVKYMSKLAKKGKTIFMTIHQPNSQIFQSFDRLILLAEGKLIYQGRIDQSLHYFADMGLGCPQFANPADHYMSIMHAENPANVKRYPQYFDRYNNKCLPSIKNQIQNRNINIITKRVVQVPFVTSFSTLISRDFKNVLRNPLLIKLRFIQTIFIAIYSSGLYCKFSGDYKNITNWRALMGFFMFLSINMLMLALAPVQLVFPSQRNVFLKQQGAKMYTVFSYFVSRNIIQIPYTIIFPMLQCLITYWFVGLSSTAQQFFTFYLIGYLLTFCGTSVGLLLGSIIHDQKSMSTVTPIILLPLILFSGLFKNQANYPDWIGWIQYISPLKYSYSSFFNNQVPKDHSLSLISTLNFDLGIWQGIGCLVGLGVGIRLLSLFFLWVLRSRLQ